MEALHYIIFCFFETWRAECGSNPRFPTFQQAALTTAPGPRLVCARTCHNMVFSDNAFSSQIHDWRNKCDMYVAIMKTFWVQPELFIYIFTLKHYSYFYTQYASESMWNQYIWIIHASTKPTLIQRPVFAGSWFRIKSTTLMGIHPVESVKLTTLKTNHQILFSDARSRLVSNNARGVTGRCEANAGLMLAQCRRRWDNIKSALDDVWYLTMPEA